MLNEVYDVAYSLARRGPLRNLAPEITYVHFVEATERARAVQDLSD